jgi:hypothetical protein
VSNVAPLGYASVAAYREYYGLLSSDDFDSWADAVGMVEVIRMTKDLRLIERWSNILGSKDALDEFLFEFLMTLDSNIYSPVIGATASMLTIALTDHQNFSGRVTQWLYPNLFVHMRQMAASHNGTNPPLTKEDADLLLLFGLCFPKSSEALAGWLRAADSKDAMKIGKLLRAGVEPDAVRQAIDNGIDTALMESLGFGKNTL